MAADPNYYKEVTPLQDETGTEPTQPVPAYGSACLRHTPQKLMRASSVTLSSETGVDRYGVCAPCQEDGRVWELKFRPSGISEIHPSTDGRKHGKRSAGCSAVRGLATASGDDKQWNSAQGQALAVGRAEASFRFQRQGGVGNRQREREREKAAG